MLYPTSCHFWLSFLHGEEIACLNVFFRVENMFNAILSKIQTCLGFQSYRLMICQMVWQPFGKRCLLVCSPAVTTHSRSEIFLFAFAFENIWVAYTQLKTEWHGARKGRYKVPEDGECFPMSNFGGAGNVQEAQRHFASVLIPVFAAVQHSGTVAIIFIAAFSILSLSKPLSVSKSWIMFKIAYTDLLKKISYLQYSWSYRLQYSGCCTHTHKGTPPAQTACYLRPPPSRWLHANWARLHCVESRPGGVNKGLNRTGKGQEKGSLIILFGWKENRGREKFDGLPKVTQGSL